MWLTWHSQLHPLSVSSDSSNGEKEEADHQVAPHPPHRVPHIHSHLTRQSIFYLLGPPTWSSNDPSSYQFLTPVSRVGVSRAGLLPGGQAAHNCCQELPGAHLSPPATIGQHRLPNLDPFLLGRFSRICFTHFPPDSEWPHYKQNWPEQWWWWCSKCGGSIRLWRGWSQVSKPAGKPQTSAQTGHPAIILLMAMKIHCLSLRIRKIKMACRQVKIEIESNICPSFSYLVVEQEESGWGETSCNSWSLHKKRR